MDDKRRWWWPFRRPKKRFTFADWEHDWLILEAAKRRLEAGDEKGASDLCAAMRMNEFPEQFPSVRKV